MYDYEVSNTIYKIPVEEIYGSDDFNCRQPFTLQSVKSLADTIEGDGKLLQAIMVQPMEDVPEEDRIEGKKWRVVIGHRRLAAVRLLGHKTIEAKIEIGLTALQASRDNLLENMERKDVNIMEEAAKIHIVWKGVSDKQVAKELKRPKKWVQTRRRLIEFPEEIQQAAASGRLSQYDVEFIGQVEPERRLVVFNQILAKKAGKNVSAPRVKERVYKKSKYRTKPETSQMLIHIMELSHVLNFDCSEVASTLAWVLGNITTRELLDKRLPLYYDESLFDD
jgi:ParB/RepB/Spo0J family partition protein